MNRFTSLLGITALIVLAESFSCSSPRERTFPYDKVPSAASSSTYRVTTNGVPVPVEFYGTATGNVSFARFAFSGEAIVAVTVKQPINRYVLSPTSVGISATVVGNTLSFTLTSPRRLVLRRVNDLSEELFLLADLPEVNPPTLGTPGVTNALTQSGIDNHNRIDDSTGINKAIARLSAAGRGTLYFPAGVYNIQSSVKMRSNVTLYLAPGSVFQVPSNYNCCFQNQAVINFSDLSNARLVGRGVINGNAVHIPHANQDFHMIYTENANNIEIRDVVLLDQGTTGMRLVDCHDSAVRNVKIIANNPSTQSDGIDFDSSSDILVDNAFIYSSDDNTAQGGGTGVRHTVKNINDITVQNSVLYNARTGAAIKIGTTDPQASIAHEKFTDLDIVSAIQVAAFYPTQGANISNITLSRIHADEIRDRILEFQIDHPTWEAWNGRLGYIHDIYFKKCDVAAFGRRNSIFLGHSANADIQGIYFSNYFVAGRPVDDIEAAHIDTSAFVSGIAFQP